VILKRVQDTLDPGQRLAMRRGISKTLARRLSNDSAALGLRAPQEESSVVGFANYPREAQQSSRS